MTPASNRSGYHADVFFSETNRPFFSPDSPRTGVSPITNVKYHAL